MQNREYLGYGVYVSHDGYQFWLAVNHHENNVIALESSVVEEFQMYVERMQNMHPNLKG